MNASAAEFYSLDYSSAVFSGAFFAFAAVSLGFVLKVAFLAQNVAII